jgi:hypothetical protein
VPNDGVVSVQSRFSARETSDRLLAVLAARQLTVFARIDHAVGAASAPAVKAMTALLGAIAQETTQ